MNKVILSGNICKDITLQNYNTNNKNLSFVFNSIAVKDTFKTDGEYKTSFFNFKVWGTNAEYLSKYAVKGSFVIISGRLFTKDYVKDGIKKYATYVVADSVEIGRNPSNTTSNTYSQNTAQEVKAQTSIDVDTLINDDDMPW